MGARVVRLICAYKPCSKPFKGERMRLRQKTACCSYECAQALIHQDARKRLLERYHAYLHGDVYIPPWDRRRAIRWAT